METVELTVTKEGTGSKVGRKVSTTTKFTQLIKTRMAEKLYARLDPILDAQIETAIGNWKTTRTMIDVKGNESTVIDEIAPSHQSAKLLLEYILPKPEQKIQHSGGIGIVHLIKNLEAGVPEEVSKEDESDD